MKKEDIDLFNSKNARVNLVLLLSSVLLFLVFSIYSFGFVQVFTNIVNASNVSVANLTITSVQIACYTHIVNVGAGANVSNMSLNITGFDGTVYYLNTTNNSGMIGNKTIAYFNVTLPERAYNVTCGAYLNESTEIKNATNTSLLLIDLSAPVIIAANTFTYNDAATGARTGNILRLSINATDMVTGVKNATLMRNGTAVNTSITIQNNATLNLSYSLLGSDINHVYNFTYNVTDHVGSTATSSGALVTISSDGTAPGISLTSPADISNTSSTTVAFAFTATDNNDTEFNCDINITNVTTISIFNLSIPGLNVTSGAAHTNSTTLTHGIYRWSVNCTDGAGNVNTSLARTFRVDTIKPGFLSSTLSGTNDSEVIPYEVLAIGINVTEMLTGISSARLLVNISGAEDNEVLIVRNVPNNTAVNFSYRIPISAINGTAFNFTIQINDTVGNYNNSETLLFNVSDNTPPNLTVNKPSVTQDVSGFVINISVSTDATACLFKLNATGSSTSNTSTATPSGGFCTWDLVNFKNGVYNYTFNATDALGNSNLTNATQFTVADSTAPSSPNASRVSTSQDEDSATITISGLNESSNATVSYGTSIGSLNSVAMQTDFSPSQEVSLSGLNDDTTYYFSVRVCDYNGNCALNGTFNLTTDEDDTPASGGSGGGGAAAAPAATSNVAASTGRTWDKIEAGASATLSISNTNIALTSVEISSEKGLTSPGITVESLKAKPTAVASDASTKTYQYLEIKKTNFQDSDLSSAKIKFKVTKAWLTANSVNEGAVALYRYNSGSWNKLETVKTGGAADPTYWYYEATTPGFSTFAIGVDETYVPSQTSTPSSASCGNSLCEAGETTESCASDCPAAAAPEAEPDATEQEQSEKEQKRTSIAWIVVGLLIIISAFGYYKWQTKKERHHHGILK